MRYRGNTHAKNIMYILKHSLQNVSGNLVIMKIMVWSFVSSTQETFPRDCLVILMRRKFSEDISLTLRVYYFLQVYLNNALISYSLRMVSETHMGL